MIQQESKLKVADNSGAKEVQCIRVLGSKKYARIGDKIVVTVKRASSQGDIAKGKVLHAVVVRTKKEQRRKDGTYIRFDHNACAIIDTNNKLKATRIKGIVPKAELYQQYPDIVSLAPETV